VRAPSKQMARLFHIQEPADCIAVIVASRDDEIFGRDRYNCFLLGGAQRIFRVEFYFLKYSSRSPPSSPFHMNMILLPSSLA
jgi:hypothetical protein